MSKTISIHFQEGFAGQTVELWRGDEQLGSWPLETRMQIGLAHIETVEAETGEQLQLVMPETGATVGFVAPELASGPESARVILVNLDGQELHVQTTEDEPRYM